MASYGPDQREGKSKKDGDMFQWLLLLVSVGKRSPEHCCALTVEGSSLHGCSLGSNSQS